jgi:hypothetical protein
MTRRRAIRRRIHGARGRRLLRQRGERLERSFAHACDTGALRRVFLRGHQNSLKRVLVHIAGLNLGLLMRTLCGVGTPRSLQGRAGAFWRHLWGLTRRLPTSWTAIWTLSRSPKSCPNIRARWEDGRINLCVATSATGR